MNQGNEDKIEKVRQAQKEGVDVPPSREQSSFDEKMQDLGVEEKKSIIKWRTKFSKYMIAFLLLQYKVIIIFLFLQGFNAWGFNLNNYIFCLLIFGTFAQSCFLVQIIFKHVFSHKK